MMRQALICFLLCGLGNDDLFANECSTAQPIDRYSFTDEVDAFELNWSQEDPAPCEFVGGSSWYRLDPDTNTTVHIESYRSDFPTMLALYEGTCGALTTLECNRSNQLRQELEAGKTYYLQALAVWGTVDTKLRLNINQRGNVRLGFPQLAVGEGVTSTVDLTNQGTETFVGLLAALDNDGNHLDLSINGELVDDDYAIEVEPRAVTRLELTRSGDPVAGHMIVYDRSALQTLDVKAQIDGTLGFQFRKQDQLLESIGVPACSVFYGPGVKEHFYSFLEHSATVRTGLALSHPGSPYFGASSVRVKALNGSGQIQEETTLVIEPLHHESFYLDERLNLPSDFIGLALIESDLPLFVLALRSENNLLSAVQVSPAPAVYNFRIELFDDRVFDGEMSLNISDVRVQGLARFTSHAPDRDFERTPVTGAAIAGLFIASLYTSLDGTPAVITLVSPFARTRFDQIGGSVIWSEVGRESIVGSFHGTRQGSGTQPTAIPPEAYKLLRGGKQ